MGVFVLRYLPYLMVIALWIYAFVDCLGTPEREVRGLPKVVWVLIILFFGEVLVGPVAWLLIGRRRGPAAARGAGGATPSEWHREYDGDDEVRGRRGGRAEREVDEPRRPRRQVWVAPDDNPEFLRSLSELNKQNKQNGNGKDGGASPSEGDQ